MGAELAHGIGGDGLRIAPCRIVGRDRNSRVQPEGRAAGKGSVSNTSSAAAWSVPSSSEARMSASFCNPPRPALIRIGPGIAPRGKPEEELAVEDAERRLRQRQQADEDIAAGEKSLQPRRTAEDRDRAEIAPPPAPARHIVAMTASLRAASAPSTPMPMTPTRTFAAIGGSSPSNHSRRNWASSRGAGPPMLHQHLHHHPFGHAQGEIRIDHAGQRHVWA